MVEDVRTTDLADEVGALREQAEEPRHSTGRAGAVRVPNGPLPRAPGERGHGAGRLGPARYRGGRALLRPPPPPDRTSSLG
jgi:hypothetical protein